MKNIVKKQSAFSESTGESIVWEIITPELAIEYLTFRNPENRIIKNWKVDEYVADILSGNWDILSPENIICFNQSGILVNGHHRLTAIIKAGVPLKMRVWRGVSDSVKIFDRGALRTTKDTLHMSGFDRQIANNNTIALIKYLFRYIFPGGMRATDAMIGQYLTSHEEDLVMATKLPLAGGGDQYGRMASIYAATYAAIRSGMGAETLDMFFRVLNTGIQFETWQTAPVVLRRQIESLKRNNAMRSEANRMRVQRITEKAFSDFENKVKRQMNYKFDMNNHGQYSEYLIKADSDEYQRITGKK